MTGHVYLELPQEREALHTQPGLSDCHRGILWQQTTTHILTSSALTAHHSGSGTHVTFFHLMRMLARSQQMQNCRHTAHRIRITVACKVLAHLFELLLDIGCLLFLSGLALPGIQSFKLKIHTYICTAPMQHYYTGHIRIGACNLAYLCSRLSLLRRARVPLIIKFRIHAQE